MDEEERQVALKERQEGVEDKDPFLDRFPEVMDLFLDSCVYVENLACFRGTLCGK